MKKLIIVPTLLAAIGGGFMLAQTNLLHGSAEEQNMIKAAEAKQIALDLYSGTIVSFEFDKKDRKPHYEIEIVSNTEKVEIEVDAVSSKAVIKEREALDQEDQAELVTIENVKISQDAAVQIAQAQFEGTLHEISIDEEDNRFIYEVELHSATEKAEFDIDVITGAILKVETKPLNKVASGQNIANSNASPNNASSNNNVTNKTALQNIQKNDDKAAGNAANGNGNSSENKGKNQNNNNPKPSTPPGQAGKIITLEEAKQIALSKAAGTVVEAELDGMKYEIEIHNGKMEYEFEIHANTGAILSYEEDLND